MSTLLKTKEDIEKLRKGGKIAHRILRQVAKMVKPGISTWELNQEAERLIKEAGAKPAFKGFGPKNNPYPAALCTSVNSVVVHGIPSKKDILEEGDIVTLDIGIIYEGMYTDTAISVGVGKISERDKKLIESTEKALEAAIKKAKVGNRLGDLGHAAQEVIEKAGFSVIRDLVGHGVGYGVHEDPMVPNYGKPGTGMVLKEGMVLAIEPMAAEGHYDLYFYPDDWVIGTADESKAAHTEHTVAITKAGPEILT